MRFIKLQDDKIERLKDYETVLQDCAAVRIPRSLRYIVMTGSSKPNPLSLQNDRMI